nr:hypothetical protein [Myxococcota bacterium]
VWIGDAVYLGFVDDLRFDAWIDGNAAAHLERVLDSPLAAYVRGATFRGEPADLEPALDAIAAREQRWLERLTIWSNATVSDGVRTRLFAATPRLRRLELHGPALGAFSHPTIRELQLTGLDTCSAIGFADVTFDAVEHLDLVIADSTYWVGDEEIEQVPIPQVVRVRMPSLRSVDLSRDVAAVAWRTLPILPNREHITRLRLPALRGFADQDALVDAVRGLPALTEIEIARPGYFVPRTPREGINLIVPEPWPWPEPANCGHMPFLITRSGAAHGEVVWLDAAARQLEAWFNDDSISPEGRAAWRTFWATIKGPRSWAELPATVLATALESLPSLVEGGWRELREDLQRACVGDVVRIEVEQE